MKIQMIEQKRHHGHVSNARYSAYLEYIKASPHLRQLVITDVSDVVFQGDPFSVIGPPGFYTAVERADLPPREPSNLWNVAWLSNHLFCHSQTGGAPLPA